MKVKVGSLDFAKKYSRGNLEQGEMVYDLSGVLGVWTGNFFSKIMTGVSSSNGNLDNFDRIHRTGIYNVSSTTTGVPASKTGFAFFIKRNISADDDANETIKINYNELQLFSAIDNMIYIRSINGQADGTIKAGSWKVLYDPNPLIVSLDTPYYTLKMQQEGIYEDYVAYRDELHEYENSQTTNETMLLPALHEPEIPESVKAFAERYKLI